MGYDEVDVAPKPYSLIESMRDIGYSLETAIADIIDNSITAEASNIHLRFSWNNGDPWIAIIDDGVGMSKDELINAMRFVSTSPTELRDSEDLGRFGLGLKTASISQCRCLTVFTKKFSQESCAQWDLDYLSTIKNNNWILKLYEKASISNDQLLSIVAKYLHSKPSGTVVFWSRLDRLSKNDREIENANDFDNAINQVRKHLGLVFHRYLSQKAGKKSTNIFFNEDAIEAFDPFFTSKSAELRKEEFLYENETIKVQPYVLPHHNKVSRYEWKKYSGDRGYLHEQGFYVYRNKRLIIYGTWFRLMPKDELTKLLRVQVDIPNTQDHLWRIDIKKASAYPPYGIREGLKRIINKIELSGKRVYKQRGQRLSSAIKVPGWRRIARENEIFYEINKEHPIIRHLFAEMNETNHTLLDSIIEMLEASFPIELLYNDMASEPENISKNSLTDDQLRGMLNILIGQQHSTPNKVFFDRILASDPFANHKDITIKQIRNLGYDY